MGKYTYLLNTTEVHFLLKLIASYCKNKTAFWKPYRDTMKIVEPNFSKNQSYLFRIHETFAQNKKYISLK